MTDAVTGSLPYVASLAGLPAQWPAMPWLAETIARAKVKVVVVDDDPTGTQSVFGVRVLTSFSVVDLSAELSDNAAAFYVLTNSRSMSSRRAREVNLEVGRNVAEAARLVGRRYVVVSRSDSTLRGHFPHEVEGLAEGLGEQFAGWLLVPYFEEGGRFTIDDIHYVLDGDQLVPAAATPFARDSVFGYNSSNLREWVEEKTRGMVRAADVVSLSIAEIRIGGPDAVESKLLRLHDRQVCVVNAASRRDLEVLVAGLLQAEEQGRRFLYRTAASFVPVRAGLPGPVLIVPADLGLTAGRGGLVVVGSYVTNTTLQLDALLATEQVVGIPVNARALSAAEAWQEETGRAAREIDESLAWGRDVVVYTSREVITDIGDERNLGVQSQISARLAALVGQVRVQPRYLLAKGGITSSDLFTKALGANRATVLGQLLPGIPVWRIEPPAPRAGLPFIVFPGNVGGRGTLAEAVSLLRAKA